MVVLLHSMMPACLRGIDISHCVCPCFRSARVDDGCDDGRLDE